MKKNPEHAFDDAALTQSNRVAAGEKWEERVSRRLQRITDALNKELSSSNNALEYGRLHLTLTSLENEMLSHRHRGLSSSLQLT